MNSVTPETIIVQMGSLTFHFCSEQTVYEGARGSVVG
jgi:hypothetical protein